MDVYYHPISTIAFQDLGDDVTRPEQRAATGELEEVQRHPGDGLVVRVIAACAFVAALFALIGGAIELALAL